eukprot:g13986.t1
MVASAFEFSPVRRKPRPAPSTAEIRKIKIAFLGDAATGKTTLCNLLAERNGSCLLRHSVNLVSFSSNTVGVDLCSFLVSKEQLAKQTGRPSPYTSAGAGYQNNNVVFQVMAGPGDPLFAPGRLQSAAPQSPPNSKFEEIRSEFYKESQLVCLVCDCGSRRSQLHLEDWWRELQDAGYVGPGNKNKVCVVVNKSDLAGDMYHGGGGDAGRGGKEWAVGKKLPVFDVSAKTGGGLGGLLDFEQSRNAIVLDSSSPPASHICASSQDIGASFLRPCKRPRPSTSRMAARTTAPRATAPFPATLATAPSLFRRGLLVLQKSGQFGTVVAEAKQEGGASNNAPTCLVSKLFSEDVENAVEEVPLADLAAIEISVLWGCNIASVEDAAKACASLASMNNQLHVDGVSPRFFLSYAFAETVDGETEKSVRELFQYLQEKSPAFRGGKLAKVVEYESCGSGKKKRSKKEKGGEGPHLPTVMQHYAGLMQYVPKSSASEMKNELQSTKAGRGISAFAPPSRTSKGADDGGAGGSTSPIADSPSTLASDAKTNSAASPQCPLHSWVFFHTDVISGPLKLRFFLDQICIAGLQKLKLGYNTMSISGDNLVVKITADEKTKSGKAKPPVAVKFDANGVAQGLRGGKLKMLTTTSAGKTGSGSVQKPSSQNNHNEQKPPAESFSLRGELCEVAAQAGVLQEFFDLNKTPASRLLESKFSDTALYYYLRDYNKQLEGLELSGTKEEEELIAEKYWMQLSTNTTGTSLGSPSCTPAGGEASPASSSGKNATWLTYFERSAAGSSNATTITDAAGGKSKSAGEDDAEARAEAKMLATDFDDEILGTSEAYNMGWQAMLPFLSPLDRKRLFATLRENLELLVCFFYGVKVPDRLGGTAAAASFPIRKLRALDATVAERDAVYEDAGVDPERAARAANKTKQKAQAAEKLLPAIDEGDAPAAPKPMAVSSGPESKSGEPATGQKQNKKDDEAKKPNTTTALQQLRKRQVIPKENRRGTKEDFEGGMRTAELEFQQYLRAVQPDLAMRIAKRFDIPLVEDAEKRVAKHFAKEIRPLAEKWMCEVPPK